MISRLIIAWISFIFGGIYTSIVWGVGVSHYQCIPCKLGAFFGGIALIIGMVYIFGTRYGYATSDTPKMVNDQAVTLMGFLLGAGYSSLVWGAALYVFPPTVLGAVIIGIVLAVCAVITLITAIEREHDSLKYTD